MFETVINVEESPEEIVLKKEDVDTDGMNYLAGKTVDFVNKSAMNGTILAHTDGNVPNLMVKVPDQNDLFWRFFYIDNGFKHDACAVLDELSHGVQVCGQIYCCREDTD